MNMRAYVIKWNMKAHSDAKEVKSISFLLRVSLLKLFVCTSGNAVTVGKNSNAPLFRSS